VQIVEIEGKNVITINVPRANRHDKPVYINNNPVIGTYRRNYSGDYKCKQEQLNMMYQDKLDTPIDGKLVESLKFEDLNQNTIKAYRNRFANLKPDSRWNEFTDREFLYRISAMGKNIETNELHPTIAGLLMFGNEREITEEFSNYFLDYKDKSEDSERWIDRVTSQEGDDRGNLYEFYHKVASKLTSHLKVPFALDKTMTRIDDTDAHKAIREAFANSLIHANFYGRRGIVIEKTKDIIVISNPGVLRIPADEAMQGGVSDPRNPNILKMFSFINVGERAGSGLENIEMVCKEQGWEGPILKEEFDVDRTILTIKTKIGDKSATMNKE
jgi:predicted HTH transcriptional regulator